MLGRPSELMRYARALSPTLEQAPTEATSVSPALFRRAAGGGEALKRRGVGGRGTSESVARARAVAQILDLVQQALRVPAAGEAA